MTPTPDHVPATSPVGAAPPDLRRLTIMTQWWREITFLHWRVDPARVAPLLPRGVRPDVVDGSTWVGLIPFRMVGAGVGRGPAVPRLGTFCETNVRVYSVGEDGRRGVVFLSLEAERLAVVLGARAVFGIPYMWARMAIEWHQDHPTGPAGPAGPDEPGGPTVTYRSRRRAPGPRGAGGRIVVRPGAAIRDPDPLQVFLTARWAAHSRHLGRLLHVPNSHEPWPLRAADLVSLDDSLLAAAGLPGLVDRPPDSVLYSDGVFARFARPHVGR